MMDQIVEEEINRIEEDYGMNMWTSNVIYYLLFDISYIIRKRKFTERTQSTKTTQEARMEGQT